MRPAVGFMLYNANNLNISLQAGQREKLSLVEIIRRDLLNFIQHVMLVGLVVGWSVRSVECVTTVGCSPAEKLDTLHCLEKAP